MEGVAGALLTPTRPSARTSTTPSLFHQFREPSSEHKIRTGRLEHCVDCVNDLADGDTVGRLGEGIKFLDNQLSTQASAGASIVLFYFRDSIGHSPTFQINLLVRAVE
jgi:hypothetical protein